MQTSPTPGVVKWYRFYVWTLSLIYLILLLGSAVGLYFSISVSPSFWREIETPPWIFYGYLVLLLGMSLLLAGVFLSSFFIPRKPWAWTYHLILICLGFSSPCYTPICVPLLIYWLQPEAKAYFGRT